MDSGCGASRRPWGCVLNFCSSKVGDPVSRSASDFHHQGSRPRPLTGGLFSISVVFLPFSNLTTLEQLGNQHIYSQAVNEQVPPQVNGLRLLLATVRHGKRKKERKRGVLRLSRVKLKHKKKKQFVKLFRRACRMESFLSILDDYPEVSNLSPTFSWATSPAVDQSINPGITPADTIKENQVPVTPYTETQTDAPRLLPVKTCLTCVGASARSLCFFLWQIRAARAAVC